MEKRGTQSPIERATVLSVRDVRKDFGGARALDSVSLDFRAGEICALLGENGAGKSTLVKIVAKLIQPDSGVISGPAYDDPRGVAMVFQELSVLPRLSVRENLQLAISPRRRSFFSQRSGKQRMLRALASAGLEGVDVELPVDALSLGQRQLLEIARGLAAESQLLILDEPTATLSDIEIERIHGVIRSTAESGKAIVYITHRLGEVFSLSDRVAVMRSGKVVADGPTSQFQMSGLVNQMLGREHQMLDRTQFYFESPDASRRRLVVSGLASEDLFSDISFEAKGGAVIALFGQLGSGASDVVRAIAGITPIQSGHLVLDGETLERLSRPTAVARGISYVSPDRVLEGVFLGATVVQNMSSGALSRVSRAGVISSHSEMRLADDVSSSVAFDTRRLRARVLSLSGGNQQKVAIGRALASSPSVVILNEPTRGVDIGARTEIYRALRQLAARNVILLVYSSDIVELRELADVVLTMFRGNLVGRHDIDAVTDAQLLTEILHGSMQ